MRGGFWPLSNRIMTACIWMGIQAYWGGQAVKIIFGAVIGPKFVNWANTLPVGAHVDTASLVCFFVFLAVFAPMLLVGAGEVGGAVAGCVCDDHLYGGWDACLGALYRWRCGYFGPYGADGAGEHVELEHGIWSSIDCWGVWNWLSGAV